MKDVFISYTTADKEFAYDLVDFLEKNKVKCYIAPRDVEKGKAYASCLMKAIDECKVVLLVSSNAINASEHVLNEVDVIVDRKKPLLPVVIEDFQLNDDFRYYIGRRQWVVAYPGDPRSFFSSILDELLQYLPREVAVEETKVEDVIERTDPSKTTIFDFYPERGIMINPKDHQRNVSFRTDTFVNMMRGIYEKIEAVSNSEEAEKAFFDSGYVSGKNFAEKIEEQWNIGFTFEDIKFKFNKWCEFDSSVGWGHFNSSISIDEQNDVLTGTISISEPFIVDYKKKTKICGFIRGYCTGVAETLFNSVEVDLVCKECPLKSKFKTKCVFEIDTK